MRGKLTIIVLVSGLVFASAAWAATSAPVGGGHYKGKDNSKTFYPTNRSVTLAVTKNKANFASGRINFVLKGQAGLGSCAGSAYVTLTPTHARQISTKGTFDLHGHFTFKVPTPYGPVRYKTSATIKGGFSDVGKKVAGTLQETASSQGLTCRSGVVRFTAALVK
jgi:hypothetical protein